MAALPDNVGLLGLIKERLLAVYGSRLQGVVLFGSQARGEARPDSDIDVLVLLTGPVACGRELFACVDALYPLSLRLGRPISPQPAAFDEYQRNSCPLYQEAHREGLVA